MERIHALCLERVHLRPHDDFQRLFWGFLLCDLEPLLEALQRLWTRDIDGDQDDVSSAEEGRIDPMEEARSGPQLQLDLLAPLFEAFDPELDSIVHHPRVKDVVGEAGVETLDSRASIAQCEELEQDIVL